MACNGSSPPGLSRNLERRDQPDAICSKSNLSVFTDLSCISANVTNTEDDDDTQETRILTINERKSYREERCLNQKSLSTSSSFGHNSNQFIHTIKNQPDQSREDDYDDSIELISPNVELSESSDVKSSSPTVTFGNVEIKEHPIIVGVNPGGTKGPPLTIGWDSVAYTIVSIDSYEALRSAHRRGHDELIISSSDRENILRNKLGFKRSEINRGTKMANIVRGRRRSTTETLEFCQIYEKIEYSKRNLIHMITFGSKKRAEKNYMKQCLLLDFKNQDKHNTGSFKNLLVSVGEKSSRKLC